MPELPEVETIVSDLNKKILGLKIEDFWTDNSKKFFLAEAKGRKIIKVIRKGKNILIYLSGNKLILIHLKLTGRLLIDQVDNYVHLIFYLNNGQQLALSDLRKFAKVLIGSVKIIENLSELKKLGPNPLKISFDKFRRILQQTRGKIKPVLLNQEVFAGIGNIYSDEILWQAGIHPLKLVKKLSLAEIKKTYNATKKILTKAVELRGTSISDYRDTAGKEGRYNLIRKAYQREGEKCQKSNCVGAIKRIKIAGRSAHFCFKHQIL